MHNFYLWMYICLYICCNSIFTKLTMSQNSQESQGSLIGATKRKGWLYMQSTQFFSLLQSIQSSMYKNIQILFSCIKVETCVISYMGRLLWCSVQCAKYVGDYAFSKYSYTNKHRYIPHIWGSTMIWSSQ